MLNAGLQNTLIKRLEADTATVKDASLAQWLDLARLIKRDPGLTAKPWGQMKARIQCLVANVGLITDSDFVDQTEIH